MVKKVYNKQTLARIKSAKTIVWNAWKELNKIDINILKFKKDKWAIIKIQGELSNIEMKLEKLE